MTKTDILDAAINAENYSNEDFEQALINYLESVEYEYEENYIYFVHTGGNYDAPEYPNYAVHLHLGMPISEVSLIIEHSEVAKEDDEYRIRIDEHTALDLKQWLDEFEHAEQVN